MGSYGSKRALHMKLFLFVVIPGDRAAKSPEQSKLSPLLLELLLRGLGDQGSPTKEGMEWSETRNTGM